MATTRRTFDTVVHQEMANADNMSGGSGSGHCNDEDGNETITIKISIVAVVASMMVERVAASPMIEIEEIEDRMSDEIPCRGITGIPMISIDAPPPLANIVEACTLLPQKEMYQQQYINNHSDGRNQTAPTTW